MTARWDFPLLGTASPEAANDARKLIFENSEDLSSLAREICQNSLDARRKDLPEETPVTVNFTLIKVKKREHEMFTGFESIVDGAAEFWNEEARRNAALEGSNKTREFITKTKAALQSEEVPILVISDYGTTGLTGSKDNTGFWRLLVNIEGESGKQNDDSAGSYGVGKNAPFAHSTLGMVLYNTYAEDGGRAFQGAAQFVTAYCTKENGRKVPTRGVGKFLDVEDEEGTWHPVFSDDECSIARLDVFDRQEYGTDVAIVGFDEEKGDWEKQLAIDLLKNFVVAIMNGKLKAEISSPKCAYTIERENLETLLFVDLKNESELEGTRQIHETITYGESRSVKIIESDDLTIYARYEDRYTQAFSRFRDTGMLINTKKEGSLPHFSVVIIVNGVGEKKLSKLLREAEPPQHTEWAARYIKDKEIKKKFNYRNHKIRDAVQTFLNELNPHEFDDSVDAGIGAYLPDEESQGASAGGSDDLKPLAQVVCIRKGTRSTRRTSQRQNAASTIGSEVDATGVKAGDGSGARPSTKKIPVVDPEKGEDRGVASGRGKVLAPSAIIEDDRICPLGGTLYRHYIKAKCKCPNICICYSAVGENGQKEGLNICTYTVAGVTREAKGSKGIGPISLEAGDNVIFVKMESAEVVALLPEFTAVVNGS